MAQVPCQILAVNLKQAFSVKAMMAREWQLLQDLARHKTRKDGLQPPVALETVSTARSLLGDKDGSACRFVAWTHDGSAPECTPTSLPFLE